MCTGQARKRSKRLAQQEPDLQAADKGREPADGKAKKVEGGDLRDPPLARVKEDGRVGDEVEGEGCPGRRTSESRRESELACDQSGRLSEDHATTG